MSLVAQLRSTADAWDDTPGYSTTSLCATLREGATRLERLEEFAEWLVAMDDPENGLALAERREITLTKIINRASTALA